ncbi:MAG: hypothetical protein KDA75_18830, partial [Planctomycetaceae bacterium]|nr:hypothetical protein [Planctomycetaceae bacterium]
VVCAGIDPRRAATEIGVTAPELSAESLEKFWRGWPGGTSESPLQYLIEILRDSPREFGLLQILKIKIAMRAIPPVMWCFALLALVSGVHRQTRVWLTEALTGIAAAAVLWNAYKLVTALCAGTVVAFSDRSARGKSGPECYLAGVVYGYLLMCVVSIAHIRFGRPVLAEFYFLAATGCLTIFFPPSSSPSKFSVREAKL